MREWLNEQLYNPSNKFSVSSHELYEHSLLYICVLILSSNGTPFMHFSALFFKVTAFQYNLICHQSRYIMEEAAVCMDTRAAVIPLQYCTWPTAISYKSETTGQNQPWLLSALSPLLCNCTLFHILNGCNYSGLQSGRYNCRHDQTRNTNIWIDALHRPIKWKGILHTDTGYIPTIAFRTAADGTAYRNPAIPLPKKDCTNYLQKANDWEVLKDKEHKQILFPLK